MILSDNKYDSKSGGIVNVMEKDRKAVNIPKQGSDGLDSNPSCVDLGQVT